MIIQSTRVYVAGSFMKAAIRIEEQKIEEILEYGSVPADIDYGDLRIVPGFIDIHCHGAFGWDTNDATPDGLEYWAKKIVREGVTSFLATTVTQMKPVLLEAVKNVAEVMEQQKPGPDGAEILGIHFEGPYLNPKHKGAQPPEAIVPPSVEEFREYQAAANGAIRVITLAPELDEEFALTRYCRDTGVRVSIGHTDATYEQVMLAAANGAVSITHTFDRRADAMKSAATVPFLNNPPCPTRRSIRISSFFRTSIPIFRDVIVEYRIALQRFASLNSTPGSWYTIGNPADMPVTGSPAI